MPQFKQFKDLSITFDTHPQTKDLLLVKNENAIKSAIKNLIVTKKNERFFNSEFGTSITSLLFELLDFGIAGQLKSEISSAIARYEPRVNLTDVTVLPNYDDNGYEVEIEFEIKGIDIIPTSMEFFLERTR
jgi:phage baseplate assembly protein W